MKCPKCNVSISPLKVWLISRWSFVKCGKCGAQFGRNIDAQLWIIWALLSIPMIVLQLSIFDPMFLVWAGIVMFLDAYTIKLALQSKDEVELLKNDE